MVGLLILKKHKNLLKISGEEIGRINHVHEFMKRFKEILKSIICDIFNCDEKALYYINLIRKILVIPEYNCVGVKNNKT